MDRIKGYDGLRALAVLLVFMGHKTYLGITSGSGGSGVRLFFVLSGFLIIGQLFRQREAIERDAADLGRLLRRFYLNRLVRIWPIYYLTLGFAIWAGASGVIEPIPPLFVAGIATFTSNIMVGHVFEGHPTAYTHFWSVAVEEQFYLWIAPLLLLTPTRHAKLALCGVIALALAVTVPFGVGSLAAYMGAFSNFGLMALGGLAALTRTPRWMLRVAPIALVLFLALPFAVRNSGMPDVLIAPMFWLSPVLIALTLKAITVDQDGLLTRALDLTPLRWLGRVSYGFYLYHLFVHIPWEGRRQVGVAIDFAATVAVASLSWKLIEEPLLNLKQRFYRLRAAPTPAAP